MKLLSREFTAKEKILLLILVLLLLGLLFYQFVHKNISNAIENETNHQYELQDELLVVQNQYTKMDKMAKELEELRASGSLTYMASYNNSKEELAFLNQILTPTIEYNITFEDLEKTGNQIRRNFVLSYKTDSNPNAENILRQLYSSENRCMIKDIVAQPVADRGTSEEATLNTNQVQYSLSAVFYETMVDGKPDGALPIEVPEEPETTEEEL